FDKVEFRHIRREENSRADWLCNQALDGFESPPDDLSQVVMPRGYNKSPRTAAPPSSKEDINKRAIAYLAEQAERWSRGDAADPDPRIVWEHLFDMIREAGLVRSPPSPRARRSPK